MINANVMALAALLAGAAPAMAEDGTPATMHDHGAMDMGKSDMAADPAAKAFTDANARMHEAMAVAPSGDADVDFVRNMIPHHQGAVDMARIELQYGKDPEIKDMAARIVAAQESEIAFFKAWLAKRGE